jgi:hypothetical protein
MMHLSIWKLPIYIQNINNDLNKDSDFLDYGAK